MPRPLPACYSQQVRYAPQIDRNPCDHWYMRPININVAIKVCTMSNYREPHKGYRIKFRVRDPSVAKDTK